MSKSIRKKTIASLLNGTAIRVYGNYYITGLRYGDSKVSIRVDRDCGTRVYRGVSVVRATADEDGNTNIEWDEWRVDSTALQKIVERYITELLYRVYIETHPINSIAPPTQIPDEKPKQQTDKAKTATMVVEITSVSLDVKSKDITLTLETGAGRKFNTILGGDNQWVIKMLSDMVQSL